MDLIFSVGIVVLVLSGVVVLMVNSVSTKTKSFDRKTASRMAELVMERMVMAKENDPVGFFGKTVYAKADGQTLDEFPGYSYSIVFGDYAGCTLSSCVKVEVTVTWAGQTNQTIKLDRIFSRT